MVESIVDIYNIKDAQGNPLRGSTAGCSIG